MRVTGFCDRLQDILALRLGPYMLIAAWLNPGGPHPTTAAGATPLHFVRNLQCGATLAAKSSNRSRLPRELLPKDFIRKVSRCLFVIQALATHLSIAQP
jgi:hypothetical protein